MNTPLVSVIVPVYKVEKTLARCLESICGQSYQNLEIIVVNDGSPDGSLAICEQFRAKDPRVVVISKENEGLSLARNAGMRVAHGKYLQFVDSDDYIEPTFTARMVEAAEKNYADLVIAPYWMVIPLASSKSGQRTEKLLAQLGVQTDTAEPEVDVYSFLPAGNYGQKEFMQKYMKKPSSFYFNVVWNKLYRRSLLTDADLWFTREVYNEDQLFNVRYFRLAKGYTSLADPGYYYIQNPQSLLHTNVDFFMVVSSRLQMFPYYKRLLAELEFSRSGQLLVFYTFVAQPERTMPAGLAQTLLKRRTQSK